MGETLDGLGRPSSSFEGLLSDSDQNVRLGFLVFEGRAGLGEVGDPAPNDLVIPDGRYEQIGIEAALHPASARPIDWPPLWNERQLEWVAVDDSAFPWLCMQVTAMPAR
ncbi:MAG: hypothetical protein KC461_12330 [Dehalococcoidia bacterium]|nr:hypothetical protein [Dehalococcoidia bacterium]